jgi:tRNA threonylcarbamoyl adenosine modification protein YeaZ
MRYLAIHSTYDAVEIALCYNNAIQNRISSNKIHASAQSIPALDALLKNQNLSIHDLTCIVAHVGPAPFTTLRVVLATVNGIQAATSIPLIGINGLDALMRQYQQPSYVTICLLNAFNQDVYYAIDSTKKGCQNIKSFLAEIAATYPQQALQFVGNGARMHHALITELFGSYAHLPDPLPDICSLDQIQQDGFRAWHESKGQKTALIPCYLKSAAPLYTPGNSSAA